MAIGGGLKGDIVETDENGELYFKISTVDF